MVIDSLHADPERDRSGNAQGCTKGCKERVTLLIFASCHFQYFKLLSTQGACPSQRRRRWRPRSMAPTAARGTCPCRRSRAPPWSRMPPVCCSTSLCGFYHMRCILSYQSHAIREVAAAQETECIIPLFAHTCGRLCGDFSVSVVHNDSKGPLFT